MFRYSLCIFAVLSVVLFILSRDIVKDGALAGLSLCGSIIIPAVFPFMFLAKMIVKLRIAETIPAFIRKAASRVFRVHTDGAAIIFLSLAAGYPVCTYLCGELCRTGRMAKEEAGRLIAYTNNATPAFIIGFGGAVLKDTGKGIALYIAVMSVTLMYGALLGRHAPKVTENVWESEYQLSARDAVRHFCSALSETAVSIVQVCAYVILFSVLSACVSALIASARLPVFISAVAALLLELTGGFSAAGTAFSGQLLFALLGGFCAFSGICVHFQVISSALRDGIGIKRFIVGKLLQGISAFLLCYLIYFALFL